MINQKWMLHFSFLMFIDVLFELSKRKPLSFSDDQSAGRLLSRTKQLRPITIPSGADISSCCSSIDFAAALVT